MKQNRHQIRSSRRQRGIVLPVTAIAMLALLACVAFALDVGHIYLNKARAQNLIDFAALSAGKTLATTGSQDLAAADARTTFFLNVNDGVGANDELTNVAASDILVDFSDTLEPWNSGGSPARFVRVRLDNNPLPTWFMDLVTNVGKNVPAHAVSGAIPVAPCKAFPVVVCAKGGTDVTDNVPCPADGTACVDAATGLACADETAAGCCEEDTANPGSCATVTTKTFDDTDRANNYGLIYGSEQYHISNGTPELANHTYCLKYSTNQNSDTYCDAAGYVKCGEFDGTTNDCIGDCTSQCYEKTFKECTESSAYCNTVELDDGTTSYGPGTVETAADGLTPFEEPLKYTEQQLLDQGLEAGNFHLLQGSDENGNGNIREEFAGTAELCIAVDVGGSGNLQAELNPGNKVGMSVQGANSRMHCYSGPMTPQNAPPDYVSNVGQRTDPLDEGCDLTTVTIGYQTDPETGAQILDAAGNPIPITQETWGSSYNNDDADNYMRDYGYASAAPDDIAAGLVEAFDGSCLNSGNCSTFDSDVVNASYGGKLMHRMLAVPVANCSGVQNGQSSVDVLAFACFLMASPMVQQGNNAFLRGQFLSLSSDASLNPAASVCNVGQGEINTTNGGATAGPTKIVLFKSPLREDS